MFPQHSGNLTSHDSSLVDEKEPGQYPQPPHPRVIVEVEGPRFGHCGVPSIHGRRDGGKEGEAHGEGHERRIFR